MSLVQNAAAAAPTPRPSPLPAPPSSVERLGGPTPLTADRIARPTAQPMPGAPSRDPPAADAALPVIIAAAVVAGGALALLGPLDVVAAGAVGAVRTAAPALGRGAAYAQSALRDAALNYREAAGDVMKLDLRDPHAVGKALGKQAWQATEEVVRGGVSGAALGGGVWVADKLGAVAANIWTRERTHEPGR